MTNQPLPRRPMFTPGPLTTSDAVKGVMLQDLGSRDGRFIEVVARIRRRLLEIAGVSQGWEAIPVQGSGTYAVEAVLSCSVADGGRVLVCCNGVYGERMVKICERHGIEAVALRLPENRAFSAETVARAIEADGPFAMVCVVHCETTTGLMNPVEEIGRVVREHGAACFVDAMSSFGAVPTDLGSVTWLTTSSNKCIEGVPGFGIVLARLGALEATRGQSRTLSLDLHEQWEALERTGQFRFTPPTHSMLAFDRALEELVDEGGVSARHERYTRVQRRISDGFRAMGFEPYLDDSQGPIITAFRTPAGFDFGAFYERLYEAGFVIYPANLAAEPGCFRVGSIGRLTEEDVDGLLEAASRIAGETGVSAGEIAV